MSQNYNSCLNRDSSFGLVKDGITCRSLRRKSSRYWKISPFLSMKILSEFIPTFRSLWPSMNILASFELGTEQSVSLVVIISNPPTFRAMISESIGDTLEIIFFSCSQLALLVMYSYLFSVILFYKLFIIFTFLRKSTLISFMLSLKVSSNLSIFSRKPCSNNSCYLWHSWRSCENSSFCFT